MKPLRHIGENFKWQQSFIHIVFCTLGMSLLAQNGKLYEKTPIKLPDSVQQRFQTDSTMESILEETTTYSIIYESDGLKIRGYMAIPKAAGTYPVIIFNRGGNRDFGAMNDVSAIYRLGTMASWGYIAIASNYRGGGGSEGMEEFGGADVNDILNLIPLLATEKKADTSRMGIYGHSRGGLMTYLTLKKTCNFKAAVLGASPTNSFALVADRPEMETNVYGELIPNYYENKQQTLTDRSPILWVDQLCKTTPLMLLHGSSDWRVLPTETLEMATKLYEQKHPFRLHFYEGADHGLSEYREEVWENIREFFDSYVRDSKIWPSLEPHGR